MKKTTYLKSVMAGVLAGAVGLSACFAPLSAQAAEKARAKQIKQAEQSKGEILLNPQLHYQTLKGWGTLNSPVPSFVPVMSSVHPGTSPSHRLIDVSSLSPPPTLYLTILRFR